MKKWAIIGIVVIVGIGGALAGYFIGAGSDDEENIAPVAQPISQPVTEPATSSEPVAETPVEEVKTSYMYTKADGTVVYTKNPGKHDTTLNALASFYFLSAEGKYKELRTWCINSDKSWTEWVNYSKTLKEIDVMEFSNLLAYGDIESTDSLYADVTLRFKDTTSRNFQDVEIDGCYAHSNPGEWNVRDLGWEP